MLNAQRVKLNYLSNGAYKIEKFLESDDVISATVELHKLLPYS